MKTNIKDFFAQKPVPDFIKGHKIWKNVEYIEKVYPRFGLPNSTEDISHNYISAITLEYFIRCAEDLDCYCKNARDNLLQKSCYGDLSRIAEYQRNLEALVQRNRESGQVIELSPVKDNVFYNNNLSIFDNYRKLRSDLMKKYSATALSKAPGGDDIYYDIKTLDRLDSYYWYNDAKSKGEKTKPNITFASGGVDGLWDILTMSMRGFRSCQSWDGQYRERLIGSLIDPYVGIIYLSSNVDTEYGKQFIYRCLVRFVIDSASNRPHLFLEKMYPEHNKAVYSLFINYLVSKTKNKFPVLDNVAKADYLPLFPSIKYLNEDTYSYRDSKIVYGKPLSEKEAKVHSNIVAKNTRIISVCKNAAFVAFSEIKPNYTQNANELICSASGKFIIRDFFEKTIARYIANYYIDCINNNTITTSKKYGRDLIYHLLRTNILYADIKNLRGTIDHYYGWHKGIKNKDLKELILPAIERMRKALKEEYCYQFVTPKSLKQVSKTLPA